MGDTRPDHVDVKQKMRNVSPIMKFLLELGPLLVFFFANYRGQWLIDNIGIFHQFTKPIFPATALFMVAILISFVVSWAILRSVPMMPLVSGIFVLFFGMLTLWLNNDSFIKIKPTLINLLFASILFIGLWQKKYFLRYVFGSAIQLNTVGWHKLTYRWGGFFIFLALVNELVWRNFSDSVWASFKVFGIMPITFIFILCQTPLLLRYSEKDD